MQGFACSEDARKPENRNNAAIAPAVERTLGKGEVACSNHASSTIPRFALSLPISQKISRRKSKRNGRPHKQIIPLSKEI